MKGKIVYLGGHKQFFEYTFIRAPAKTGSDKKGDGRYYPGGLTMAGISDKALKGQYAENKYRYNSGTELQNKEFSDGSGMELYATNYRSLDPQLGRFWQIDPLLEVSENVSPYSYGIDNPILHVDPLGLTDSIPGLKDYAPAPVVIGHKNNSITSFSVFAGVTIGKAVTDHPVSRPLVNESLRFITAEQANAESGYAQPPYKPGTNVARFKSSVLGKYVRVFNSKVRANAVGKWIMRRSEIKNLSPAEIKDRFALESEPDQIAEVEVPAGEEMEASVAGGNAWGKGGGIQYRILSKLVESWFKAPTTISTPLPDVNIPEVPLVRPGTRLPIEEIPPEFIP